MAFRFVDDFVIKGVLDSTRVKSMFGIFENEYINKKGDAFRELDAEWYILEENEVQKKIKQVFEDLENNIYAFKEYPRIIGRFVELEGVGFPRENTNIVIEKMKVNIFKLGQHINIDNGYGLLQEGDNKQRYKEIMEQLQKDIDQQFEEHISNTLEYYLNIGEGWGEKMEKYVRDNKSEIYQSSGFLRQINVLKLYEKIKESKSKDIHAFRCCIITLYISGIMGDGLKQDEKGLQELDNRIQKMKMEDFDLIKKMQINYLLKNLQNAQEIFKR